MPSSSVSSCATTRSVTWLAAAAAATRRQRVDLVEEDDAGRGLARLAKYLAHAALGLADPHAQQLRTLDRDEVRLGLAGQRLGQQRLAGARRAVQQDALGRAHAGLLERARRSCSCQSTTSVSSRLTSSSPPTSSQRTSEISVTTSRSADGSTSASALSKSARFDLELGQLVVGNFGAS